MWVNLSLSLDTDGNEMKHGAKQVCSRNDERSRSGFLKKKKKTEPNRQFSIGNNDKSWRVPSRRPTDIPVSFYSGNHHRKVNQGERRATRASCLPRDAKNTEKKNKRKGQAATDATSQRTGRGCHVYSAWAQDCIYKEGWGSRLIEPKLRMPVTTTTKKKNYAQKQDMPY